jgi:hypothetical protein
VEKYEGESHPHRVKGEAVAVLREAEAAGAWVVQSRLYRKYHACPSSKTAARGFDSHVTQDKSKTYNLLTTPTFVVSSYGHA